MIARRRGRRVPAPGRGRLRRRVARPGRSEAPRTIRSIPFRHATPRASGYGCRWSRRPDHLGRGRRTQLLQVNLRNEDRARPSRSRAAGPRARSRCAEPRRGLACGRGRPRSRCASSGRWVGDGAEPSPVRKQAQDAPVLASDRPGDHVEEVLVVRRRFGEGAQRPRQDAESVFEALDPSSGLCAHGVILASGARDGAANAG